jgi:hypothetical protein
MTALKLCFFIILSIFTSVTFAAGNCVSLKSNTGPQSVCWVDKHKAWVSEKCSLGTCDALRFLKSPPKVTVKMVPGVNPSILGCVALKLPIITLEDARGNEQTYCRFKDQTIIDSSAVESVLP